MVNFSDGWRLLIFVSLVSIAFLSMSHKMSSMYANRPSIPDRHLSKNFCHEEGPFLSPKGKRRKANAPPQGDNTVVFAIESLCIGKLKNADLKSITEKSFDPFKSLVKFFKFGNG